MVQATGQTVPQKTLKIVNILPDKIETTALMAAKAPGVTVICELGVSGLVRVDIDAIIDVAGESYIVETKMTKDSLSEGKRSPTFLPFARRL